MTISTLYPSSEESSDEQSSPLAISFDFPVAELSRLNEMISRTRWVIPVLPNGELEVLLVASIDLASRRIDKHCEPLQHFITHALPTCLQKIMTDEAIGGWKTEIQRYIMLNCERVLHLCVLKLHEDCPVVLSMLALMLNPQCRFHTYNSSQPSGLFHCGDSDPSQAGRPLNESYARVFDTRNPRGWLVDLLNRFGQLNGFEAILKRFQAHQQVPLSSSSAHALLKPLAVCHEYLSDATVQQFIVPIANVLIIYLDSLADEELKREVKSDQSKNDVLSQIVHYMKCLIGSSHATSAVTQDLLRALDMIRLKVIYRLLQVASFSARMSALNDLNRLIVSSQNIAAQSGAYAPTSLAVPASSGAPTTPYSPTSSSFNAPGGSSGHSTAQITTLHHNMADKCSIAEVYDNQLEICSAQHLAKWIQEKRVLNIVMRDSLHQPQYVDKLERIFRFLIKQKCLSADDLDCVWRMQSGKHEAIVKNIHELLAKLAWDFSAEQLDHLFCCFRRSWITCACNKQRERLLELIGRLAEDDKQGMMAHKVLHLLWSLAHSHELTTEVMDQALSAHLKILQSSCCQERGMQKLRWLNQCIDELSEPRWMLPNLRHIRHIMCLYQIAPAAVLHCSEPTRIMYRHQLIHRFQDEYSLIVLVTQSLLDYMDHVRREASSSHSQPSAQPHAHGYDGRYDHVQQIEQRLEFLHFLLRDGQLWLGESQASEIWNCLTTVSALEIDREICFQWFCLLMGDEPDLDPKIYQSFFERNILQLDPMYLTTSGIKCFEAFFRSVNYNQNRLILINNIFFTQSLDLLGIDYLWRMVICSPSSVCVYAIDLVKQIYGNLAPNLHSRNAEIYTELVSNCMERLRACYDTVGHLLLCESAEQLEVSHCERQLATMCRVLHVLFEYISNCSDWTDAREDQLLPSDDSARANSQRADFTSSEGEPVSEEAASSTADVTRPIPATCLPAATVPLYRAHRGRSVHLVVRVSLQSNRITHAHQATRHQSCDTDTAQCTRTDCDCVRHVSVHTHTHSTVARLRARIVEHMCKLLGRKCHVELVFWPESKFVGVDVKPDMLLDDVLADLIVGVQKHDQQTVVELSAKYKPLRDLRVIYESERDVSQTDRVPVREDSSSFGSSYSTGGQCGPAEISSSRILANNTEWMEFMLSIADLAYTTDLKSSCNLLQAVWNVLDATPAAKHLYQSSQLTHTKKIDTDDSASTKQWLRDTLLNQKMCRRLYFLKIFYSILAPTHQISLDTVSPTVLTNFIQLSDNGRLVYDIVLSCSTCERSSKRLSICLQLISFVFRICKMFLLICAVNRTRTFLNVHYPPVGECNDSNTNEMLCGDGDGNHEVLSSLSLVIPAAEFWLLDLAIRVAEQFSHLKMNNILIEEPKELLLKHMINLFWEVSFGYQSNNLCDASDTTEAAQCGNNGVLDDSVASREEHDNKLFSVSREIIETITLVVCVWPHLLLGLMQSEKSSTLGKQLVDILLVCEHEQLREFVCQQLVVITLRSPFDREHKLLDCMLTTFVSVLQTAEQHASKCRHYFVFLCQMMQSAFSLGRFRSEAETWLRCELDWLRKLRDQHSDRNLSIDQFYLEGRLRLLKELLVCRQYDEFPLIDADEQRSVTRDLLDVFLMPSSVQLVCLHRTAYWPDALTPALCVTAECRMAALDLIIVLCACNVSNLAHVCRSLQEFMAVSEEIRASCDDQSAMPVGAVVTALTASTVAGGCAVDNWSTVDAAESERPFVGLKNAGATCYMNSVLQQLFMIDSVRDVLLSVQNMCSFDGKDLTYLEPAMVGDSRTEKGTGISSHEQKLYNIGVLRCLQIIFAHLATSRLPFYIPSCLWHHFRLQGEPVSLREQHDAVEFFTSLVDSVDEALGALKQPHLMSRQLEGKFSDQKICKQCPHRFSSEQNFTVLSVDIQNVSGLVESLEQYVKGDLLEGANAYYCDRCARKVDTVKRTCIKRLPRTLCIQLKRFGYDWERECAIKCNDYFEFPALLDMEPYTESGLARAENDYIVETASKSSDSSDSQEAERSTEQVCNTYLLTGIIVHSGQASGGHYYSYVARVSAGAGSQLMVTDTQRSCRVPCLVWHKFDDHEVSECALSETELRAQCFGGSCSQDDGDRVTSSGEMMKRASSAHRTGQKRWWNAYMLFYTRVDSYRENSVDGSTDMKTGVSLENLPQAIKRSILRQNLHQMHCKCMCAGEFIRFIRQLSTACSVMDSTSASSVTAASSDSELGAKSHHQVALLSTKLVASFLFDFGLHMKRTLRGSAADWYDCLAPHLASSHRARAWFTRHIIYCRTRQVCVSDRVLQYLVECPAADIRQMFGRLLVLLCVHAADTQPSREVDETMEQVTDLTSDPTTAGSQVRSHTEGADSDGGDEASDAIISHMLDLLTSRELCHHTRHLAQYFDFFHAYASHGTAACQHLLRLHALSCLLAFCVDTQLKYQCTELGRVFQVISLLTRSCVVTAHTAGCDESGAQCAAMPNPYRVGGDCVYVLRAREAEIIYERGEYLKRVLDESVSSEDTVLWVKFLCWENAPFSATVLDELLSQVGYSYSFELRPYLQLLLHILLLADSWCEHRIRRVLCGAIGQSQPTAGSHDGIFDAIERFRSHCEKRAYQCIKCLVQLFTQNARARHLLQRSAEVRRRWRRCVEWLRAELERRRTGQALVAANAPRWTQSNETSSGYFVERSESALLCLQQALELCGDDQEEGAEDTLEVPEETVTLHVPQPAAECACTSAEEAGVSSVSSVAPRQNVHNAIDDMLSEL